MKSKNIRMQRRAVQAMKHAAFLGVDPHNSTTTQGLCYEQPFLVPATQHVERIVDRIHRAHRAKRRAYSISDAITLALESDDV